ncbi:MAG: class I SAM-dependent methyltransferase [Chlamydiales bacterium]|nr:class I SAM-dependent methyltransferase [Chlamydiales bacterium]
MKFSHLSFAHSYWTSHLYIGASVIDATCGNGHDALFIAKKILNNTQGSLYIFDIQESAINQAKTHLSSHLDKESYKRVHFYKQCHSNFPNELQEKSIDLIVYNLGYLPGGNKSITTTKETTLISLERSLKLIKPLGLISITCYPGHLEGEKEEELLLTWAKSLDPLNWSASFHKRINYSKAPSVLFLCRL